MTQSTNYSPNYNTHIGTFSPSTRRGARTLASFGPPNLTYMYSLALVTTLTHEESPFSSTNPSPTASKNFHAVDERIAYIDIHIHTWKLRVITGYFPHTGYCDTRVQHLYDTLTEVLRDAQTNHLHTIIAGDFNAQVGKRNANDTTAATGKFAFDPSNSRGEWLASWAARCLPRGLWGLGKARRAGFSDHSTI